MRGKIREFLGETERRESKTVTNRRGAVDNGRHEKNMYLGSCGDSREKIVVGYEIQCIVSVGTGLTQGREVRLFTYEEIKNCPKYWKAVVLSESSVSSDSLFGAR